VRQVLLLRTKERESRGIFCSNYLENQGEERHAAYVVVMFRVYCHGSRIGLR
jgi:hypothetical protein